MISTMGCGLFGLSQGARLFRSGSRLVGGRSRGSKMGPSIVVVVALVATAPLSAQSLDSAFERASQLPRLRSLIIAQDGRILGERYYHGASRSRTANVKSVSKSVISALVGIATAEGRLMGIQQPITDFFPRELRDSAHADKRRITIGD